MPASCLPGGAEHCALGTPALALLSLLQWCGPARAVIPPALGTATVSEVIPHGPPHLPSFHSLVAGLMMPNSSSQVTAFGSKSTATGFLFRF